MEKERMTMGRSSWNKENKYTERTHFILRYAFSYILHTFKSTLKKNLLLIYYTLLPSSLLIKYYKKPNLLIFISPDFFSFKTPTAPSFPPKSSSTKPTIFPPIQLTNQKCTF